MSLLRWMGLLLVLGGLASGCGAQPALESDPTATAAAPRPAPAATSAPRSERQDLRLIEFSSPF